MDQNRLTNMLREPEPSIGWRHDMVATQYTKTACMLTARRDLAVGREGGQRLLLLVVHAQHVLARPQQPLVDQRLHQEAAKLHCKWHTSEAMPYHQQCDAHAQTITGVTQPADKLHMQWR